MVPGDVVEVKELDLKGLYACTERSRQRGPAQVGPWGCWQTSRHERKRPTPSPAHLNIM